PCEVDQPAAEWRAVRRSAGGGCEGARGDAQGADLFRGGWAGCDGSVSGRSLLRAGMECGEDGGWKTAVGAQRGVSAGDEHGGVHDSGGAHRNCGAGEWDSDGCAGDGVPEFSGLLPLWRGEARLYGVGRASVSGHVEGEPGCGEGLCGDGGTEAACGGKRSGFVCGDVCEPVLWRAADRGEGRQAGDAASAARGVLRADALGWRYVYVLLCEREYGDCAERREVSRWREEGGGGESGD